MIAVCLGAAITGCGDSLTPEERTEVELVELARSIHQRVLTIDTHDDIPLNFATRDVDPGTRGDRQVDLPKMREGGLDAAFFVVYVGQTERTTENYAQAATDAMIKFEAIHRMAEDMYPTRSRSRTRQMTSSASRRAASWSRQSASRTATSSAPTCRCWRPITRSVRATSRSRMVGTTTSRIRRRRRSAWETVTRSMGV